MKNNLILVLILCLAFACKEKTEEKATVAKTGAEVAYQSFGDKISTADAITVSELSERYATLKAGDTIVVKFEGEIGEICQKKGCWMTVALPGEQKTMVRFKDYGFFVPMNAGKHKAVVAGKAFVRETSVDELKHYAKDAGKSEEEITQITLPKREFAFEANGVLIQK